MSKKDDILPLHYKSILATTSSWSDEEFGAYMRLLIKQYDSGSIPNDLDRLNKISDSIRRTWQMLEPKFNGVVGGGLQNRRMEEARREWIEEFVYKPKKQKKHRAKQTVELMVSLEERRKQFGESLKKYIDNPYSREMLLDFYHYWSEPTQDGGKMKKELQKTWDVEGRLRTWNRNNKKNQNGQQQGNSSVSRVAGNKSQINQLVAATRRYLGQNENADDRGSD